MYQNQCVKGILLLGGKSERFGEAGLKQCQRISGKKVYLHTLERFLESGYFDEIILVCHLACIEEVREDLKNNRYAIPIIIVEGGNSRQQSSWIGLKACGEKTDFVVIHDAVRPLISQQIIKNNIEQVIIHHAVDTCIPTADTLVETLTGTSIQSIPNRTHFRRGQTPQSFAYSLIVKAHQHAEKHAVNERSDDCQLVLEMGQPVFIVAGEESNIKITTELDLFLAEQLMRIQQLSLPNHQETHELQNKKYAIIGGTGGIGSALCELLIKEGAQAFVLSRHSQDYPLDIGDPQQVERLFLSLFQKHGEIDGLINSAGILKIKEVEELSSDEIHEMLKVNLHGVIFSCKSAKIKEGGHIVNIASSAYTRGRPHYAVYSCAKAAVVNFTQAFAEEYPKLNVNAIIPQRTKTPMRSANFLEENEVELLQPQEVATQIVHLLKHPRLTGTIIEIRKARKNDS